MGDTPDDQSDEFTLGDGNDTQQLQYFIDQKNWPAVFVAIAEGKMDFLKVYQLLEGADGCTAINMATALACHILAVMKPAIITFDKVVDIHCKWQSVERLPAVLWAAGVPSGRPLVFDLVVHCHQVLVTKLSTDLVDIFAYAAAHGQMEIQDNDGNNILHYILKRIPAKDSSALFRILFEGVGVGQFRSLLVTLNKGHRTPLELLILPPSSSVVDDKTARHMLLFWFLDQQAHGASTLVFPDNQSARGIARNSFNCKVSWIRHLHLLHTACEVLDLKIVNDLLCTGATWGDTRSQDSKTAFDIFLSANPQDIRDTDTLLKKKQLALQPYLESWDLNPGSLMHTAIKTGEVLPPELAEFVYDEVKKQAGVWDDFLDGFKAKLNLNPGNNYGHKLFLQCLKGWFINNHHAPILSKIHPDVKQFGEDFATCALNGGYFRPVQGQRDILKNSITRFQCFDRTSSDLPELDADECNLLEDSLEAVQALRLQSAPVEPPNLEDEKTNVFRNSLVNTFVNDLYSPIMAIRQKMFPVAEQDKAPSAISPEVLRAVNQMTAAVAGGAVPIGAQQAANFASCGVQLFDYVVSEYRKRERDKEVNRFCYIFENYDPQALVELLYLVAERIYHRHQMQIQKIQLIDVPKFATVCVRRMFNYIVSTNELFQSEPLDDNGAIDTQRERGWLTLKWDQICGRVRTSVNNWINHQDQAEPPEYQRAVDDLFLRALHCAWTDGDGDTVLVKLEPGGDTHQWDLKQMFLHVGVIDCVENIVFEDPRSGKKGGYYLYVYSNKEEAARRGLKDVKNPPPELLRSPTTPPTMLELKVACERASLVARRQEVSNFSASQNEFVKAFLEYFLKVEYAVLRALSDERVENKNTEVDEALNKVVTYVTEHGTGNTKTVFKVFQTLYKLYRGKEQKERLGRFRKFFGHLSVAEVVFTMKHIAERLAHLYGDVLHHVAEHHMLDVVNALAPVAVGRGMEYITMQRGDLEMGQGSKLKRTIAYVLGRAPPLSILRRLEDIFACAMSSPRVKFGVEEGNPLHLVQFRGLQTAQPAGRVYQHCGITCKQSGIVYYREESYLEDQFLGTRLGTKLEAHNLGFKKEVRRTAAVPQLLNSPVPQTPVTLEVEFTNIRSELEKYYKERFRALPFVESALQDFEKLYEPPEMIDIVEPNRRRCHFGYLFTESERCPRSVTVLQADGGFGKTSLSLWIARNQFNRVGANATWPFSICLHIDMKDIQARAEVDHKRSDVFDDFLRRLWKMDTLPNLARITLWRDLLASCAIGDSSTSKQADILPSVVAVLDTFLPGIVNVCPETHLPLMSVQTAVARWDQRPSTTQHDKERFLSDVRRGLSPALLRDVRKERECMIALTLPDADRQLVESVLRFVDCFPHRVLWVIDSLDEVDLNSEGSVHGQFLRRHVVPNRLQNCVVQHCILLSRRSVHEDHFRPNAELQPRRCELPPVNVEKVVKRFFETNRGVLPADFENVMHQFLGGKQASGLCCSEIT